jgi:hypothetical protein
MRSYRPHLEPASYPASGRMAGNAKQEPRHEVKEVIVLTESRDKDHSAREGG